MIWKSTIPEIKQYIFQFQFSTMKWSVWAKVQVKNPKSKKGKKKGDWEVKKGWLRSKKTVNWEAQFGFLSSSNSTSTIKPRTPNFFLQFYNFNMRLMLTKIKWVGKSTCLEHPITIQISHKTTFWFPKIREHFFH